MTPADTAAHKLVAQMRGYLGAKLEQGAVVFVVQGADIKYEPTMHVPEVLEKAIDLGLVEKRIISVQSTRGTDDIEIYVPTRNSGTREGPGPSHRRGTKSRYKSQDRFSAGGRKRNKKKNRKSGSKRG